MDVNQFRLTTHCPKILHSHWDQTFITFIVCIFWFPERGRGKTKVKICLRGNEQMSSPEVIYWWPSQKSIIPLLISKNRDFHTPLSCRQTHTQLLISLSWISLHVFMCRCLTEQFTTCCVRCWAGSLQPRSGLLYRPSQLTLQSWTLTTKSPPQPVSVFWTLFPYKLFWIYV